MLYIHVLLKLFVDTLSVTTTWDDIPETEVFDGTKCGREGISGEYDKKAFIDKVFSSVHIACP